MTLVLLICMEKKTIITYNKRFQTVFYILRHQKHQKRVLFNNNYVFFNSLVCIEIISIIEIQGAQLLKTLNTTGLDDKIKKEEFNK